MIGQAPIDYVVEKYCEYHRMPGVFAGLNSDRFDRLAVRLSARAPLLARLADTYASRFYKRSAVRKKLVLLLALLECSPPAFHVLDIPDACSRPGMYVRLGFRACLYGVMLILSWILFTPLRLFLSVPRDAPGRGDQ
ncbi:MAG: hypothetical protein HY236_03315 [Acidobacteria bacterium]|nr:hypothetical protein [Acidobacteriota bacterium]